MDVFGKLLPVKKMALPRSAVFLKKRWNLGDSGNGYIPIKLNICNNDN
jgi:hypothetical protein